MKLVFYFLITNILFINQVYGFFFNPLKKSNICLKNSNSDGNIPSEMWTTLSKVFKDRARNWFIERAEKVNISWTDHVETFNNVETFLHLKDFKDKYENKSIVYPEYFLQPFHGYDKGNMEWKAAKEAEPATYSMAVSYWKNSSPFTSQNWMRNNISQNIEDYIGDYGDIKKINTILDIGSSIGISTEYLQTHFKSDFVTGLDLSPYFVAMGNYRAQKNNIPIEIIHANAEQIPIDDNHHDLIVSNFLFHEVPPGPTEDIIKECYRVLKPGGIFAIVDLNTNNIQNNFLVSKFRKWAFEVTEPHIYQYYKTDLENLLQNVGFKNIKMYKNDPINSIWIGQK